MTAYITLNLRAVGFGTFEVRSGTICAFQLTRECANLRTPDQSANHSGVCDIHHGSGLLLLALGES